MGAGVGMEEAAPPPAGADVGIIAPPPRREEDAAPPPPAALLPSSWCNSATLICSELDAKARSIPGTAPYPDTPPIPIPIPATTAAEEEEMDDDGCPRDCETGGADARPPRIATADA